MKTLRKYVFVVFVGMCALATRAELLAWSSFGSWYSYYGNECTNWDPEEQANRLTIFAWCSDEVQDDFCDGGFDVCVDYCNIFWPEPFPWIVEAYDCSVDPGSGSWQGYWMCECQPIE